MCPIFGSILFHHTKKAAKRIIDLKIRQDESPFECMKFKEKENNYQIQVDLKEG